MPEGGSSPRFWHGSRCPKDLMFVCPSAIHHAFSPVRSNSHVPSCWCILVPVPLFPIVRIGNAISSWRIRGIKLNLLCQIDRLSLPTNPCSKPSSCWPANVNDSKCLLIYIYIHPKQGKQTSTCPSDQLQYSVSLRSWSFMLTNKQRNAITLGP